MTDVVINFADAVRHRNQYEAPLEDGTVTASETLELVRTYAQIKDPALRQLALDQLKKTVTSQV